MIRRTFGWRRAGCAAAGVTAPARIMTAIVNTDMRMACALWSRRRYHAPQGTGAAFFSGTARRRFG
jgi:hypothetical protein